VYFNPKEENGGEQIMKINDWKLIKEALQEKLINSNSESVDAHISIVLSEIEGMIVSHSMLKGNCRVCGNQFRDIDQKVRGSLPVGICSTCFTSNA
jgi:hypothetical protein